MHFFQNLSVELGVWSGLEPDKPLLITRFAFPPLLTTPASRTFKFVKKIFFSTIFLLIPLLFTTQHRNCTKTSCSTSCASAARVTSAGPAAARTAPSLNQSDWWMSGKKNCLHLQWALRVHVARRAVQAGLGGCALHGTAVCGHVRERGPMRAAGAVRMSKVGVQNHYISHACRKYYFANMLAHCIHARCRVE